VLGKVFVRHFFHRPFRIYEQHRIAIGCRMIKGKEGWIIDVSLCMLIRIPTITGGLYTLPLMKGANVDFGTGV